MWDKIGNMFNNGQVSPSIWSAFSRKVDHESIKWIHFLPFLEKSSGLGFIGYSANPVLRAKSDCFMCISTELS